MLDAEPEIKSSQAQSTVGTGIVSPSSISIDTHDSVNSSTLGPSLELSVDGTDLINNKPKGALPSFLSADELADLDVGLEEISIESLLEEKRVMRPIKVKKPEPFIFFKHAPLYR